ncbi:MAG: phosphate/phosphite/phosphonate ABC transporter substrate-binding protein [Phycisphaerae bacterium]|jgi:phosphonate transport system substrate-binding protein|nr:phosphate/phosphite/phosphonate ABC transporter substrate-binding protein [Phycisphaerae bacterium]
MRIVWTVLFVSLVILVVGVLYILAQLTGSAPVGDLTPTTRPDERDGPPLRIGLIPERDIFLQRKRYRALAEYLSVKLDRPVRLVMMHTYATVLHDFAEKNVECAFLGSLVAVLAMDRLDAQVIAKPELTGGVSSYHGVIFVRADSPVTKLEQIAGRSIGMVRTTTAGHVFPGCVLMKLKLFGRADEPRIVWIGTHDDVTRKVMDGQIDVGAMKNLRLDDLLKQNPEWKIRRLASGKCVPSNALLVRSDIAGELGGKLSKILLEMESDPQGSKTLEEMGMKRFIPCPSREYSPVYDMTECIKSMWKKIGVPGTIPKRPGDWPKPKSVETRKCYDVNY